MLYVASVVAFDKKGEFNHTSTFFSAMDLDEAEEYAHRYGAIEFSKKLGYVRVDVSVSVLDAEFVWQLANVALGELEREQVIDDDEYEDRYDYGDEGEDYDLDGSMSRPVVRGRRVNDRRSGPTVNRGGYSRRQVEEDLREMETVRDRGRQIREDRHSVSPVRGRGGRHHVEEDIHQSRPVRDRQIEEDRGRGGLFGRGRGVHPTVAGPNAETWRDAEPRQEQQVQPRTGRKKPKPMPKMEVRVLR